MTTLKTSFLLSLLLAAGFASAHAETLINLNFSPFGTTSAGVYGSAGQAWNTFNSNYMSGYYYNDINSGLVDSTNTPTSASVSFTGDAYNLANGDVTETFDTSLFGRLMFAYGTQDIDFSGLAAGNYDLIVFSANSNSSNVTFDVNGTPETLVGVQDNSGFKASPGNYVSVAVTVGSAGTLDISGINGATSGMQLESIAAPEPATLSLLAAGGLALAFALRRKKISQA